MPGVPRRVPLHVVHLVLTLNVGGLEKVVFDLIRSSDPQQCKARAICLGEIGGLGPDFEAAGIPVESLNVHHRGPIAGILALQSRLRELRPDVLHTHNAAPHVVGTFAGRLARIPVIVHTRHGQHRQSKWNSALVNRFASRCADRIIAVSEDAANVAREAEHVVEKKLRIIPNGIDLSRFQARQQGNSPPGGGCRLIHVARLNDPVKDQSTLLRAARIVANAQPNFVLEIVGDGPSREALEALCDELDLRGQVQFLGCRGNIEQLLQKADLFVLSSVTEGLSISLLEAMAAGLPIVATNVGGNPELIQDGHTGLLVPARSPGDLAAAMLALIQDFELRRRLGQAGRERVEQRFDLRHTAASYLQVYQELLTG